MSSLIERYAEKIEGQLTCWDRVVISGILPDIVHKDGIHSYLRRHKIQVRDLENHFKRLNDALRKQAEARADEAGLEIDYIRRSNFRKDDRIKEVIAERGDHAGLVHIFAAVEGCTAWRVRRRKCDGHEFVFSRRTKCLHYYFYFIDSVLGLCYFRVPTFAPFRVQFYFNGHGWLANRLRTEAVDFELIENVFVRIGDYEKAQEVAESIDAETLHRYLDRLAGSILPFLDRFQSGYRWSVWQAEIATDIIFKTADDLDPVYDHLMRTAVCTVKTDQVANFLGRRMDSRFPGEVNTTLQTRSHGTCVKHSMGKATIKMYDKLGRVLRIETTVSDVTFFSHRREVEHRDGTRSVKTAKVRKSIYSMPILFDLMRAANNRYLDFISALDDPSDGVRGLKKIAESVKKRGRSWRGFNLCASHDHSVLLAIARGEWSIQGFRNKDIRNLLGLNASQMSRIIRRLRLHSLIKKAPRAYRYHLTKLGRRLISAALRVRQEVLIPALAGI